jgi:hypothetical protein
MEKIESDAISPKISPKFFWLGWFVVMGIWVIGMAFGFWHDGRPDVISASGAVIFLILGGLYRRKARRR